MAPRLRARSPSLTRRGGVVFAQLAGHLFGHGERGLAQFLGFGEFAELFVS